MQPTASVRNRTDLLARFAEGDRDAFEALFREHQAKIFRWILRIVRDRTLAEDATIETFWRIYRAHARFDASRGFEGWARRIATNAALDSLKQLRTVETLYEMPAAPAPTADPAVEKAVRSAFRRLPAKLQAAAGLALIEELPNAEIALELGISVSAVKSRVFRAIRLLRIKLRRLGIESARSL